MSNEETPRPSRSRGQDSGEEVTFSVTAPGDIDRARRLWCADRQRHRRLVSLAFDAHIARMYGLDDFPESSPGSYDGDYWRDSGMTLGVQEREAAA